MPIRDLHKALFDEGTITKLEIFEAYTREWLLAFIHYPGFSKINIYDFFVGAGQDVSKNPGSPLRIINVIHDYKAQIIKKYKITEEELNKIKTEALLDRWPVPPVYY